MFWPTFQQLSGLSIGNLNDALQQQHYFIATARRVLLDTAKTFNLGT